jgi:hypothetical protein
MTVALWGAVAAWALGEVAPHLWLLIVGVLYRIEEKVLLDGFGAADADYPRETKRLIPGVWSRNAIARGDCRQFVAMNHFHATNIGFPRIGGPWGATGLGVGAWRSTTYPARS